MNYFLIFLLIPVSFAAEVDCSSITRIISDYEKDLQRKSINKCAEINVSELAKNHPGLEGDLTFMEQRKCHSLASIESELERLRAELSVANGIQKLKQAVQDSKASASKGNQEGGVKFVQSLDTAQSLEILLTTTDRSNVTFLQKMKEVPAEQRKTEADLKNIVKKFCERMSETEQDACNKKFFKPSAEAAREIFQLVERSEFNPEQIEKMKSMLAIQRETSDPEKANWSFTEMRSELEDAFSTLDNNGILTRAHLNAIKKLDNFTHAPGFSFVENIAAIKDRKKEKILSDKLLVLMGDAKLRQQYEAQSKLSVAWENYKNLFTSLKPEEVTSCNQAKASWGETLKCYQALYNNTKNISDAELKEILLPSIEASIRFADNVGSREESCRKAVSDTGSMPSSCYEALGQVPADIQQKIRQLNILKERIGVENQDKMIYRNFALKKWADKCPVQETLMDQCDLTDQYAISKNSLFSVMDVAIVFAPKPEAEEQAKALCEDDDKKKTKAEDKLCALFKTSDIVVITDNAPSSDASLSTDAPDGGHAEAARRDRYIEASRNLLTNALGSLMNYKYGPQNAVANFNPYPYNFSPYNWNSRPMGIADSILFNARYYGAYGYYMPTPGYQPYTAFGVNSPLTAYKPVSTAAPSKYFSY